MKKVFLLLVLLLSLTRVAAQNSDYSYERLEQIFVGLNAQMPISFGPSMEWTSADITPGECVFEYSVIELGDTQFPKAEDCFDAMKTMLSSGSDAINMLLGSIADNDMSLRMNIKGENSGKTLSVKFTPDDLREIVSTEVSAYDRLAIYVGQQKNYCPITVNESMEITDISLSDNMLVMVFTVDGNTFYALDVDAARVTMKDLLKDDLASLQTLKLCGDAGYGYCVSYKDRDSGNTKDVAFAADEVNGILEGTMLADKGYRSTATPYGGSDPDPYDYMPELDYDSVAVYYGEDDTLAVYDYDVVDSVDVWLSPEEELSAMVEQTKAECPAYIDDEMVMTDVYIADGYLVMEFTVDDVFFAQLNSEMLSDMKQQLFASSEEGLAITALCVDAGYGCAFSYKSRSGNGEISVSATLDEAKDMLRGTDYERE